MLRIVPNLPRFHTSMFIYGAVRKTIRLWNAQTTRKNHKQEIKVPMLTTVPLESLNSPTT